MRAVRQPSPHSTRAASECPSSPMGSRRAWAELPLIGEGAAQPVPKKIRYGVVVIVRAAGFAVVGPVVVEVIVNV